MRRVADAGRRRLDAASTDITHRIDDMTLAKVGVVNKRGNFEC